ncbi:phospho-sugar mutase [Demequina litorisediminis]|uniref:Phosphomannomutase n=1 Tax=Demequina litorisediminis TaxID=1849022 RepID=A0ABQ6IAX0_9MICO|nr:phospho-sugar mutase [Demequina litorisediminis]GMA34834.1 phosphomannomutase [Demequina litorisediminis]
MTGIEGVLVAARAWAEDDPDQRTREELEALIAAAEAGYEDAVDELVDAFRGMLQFGTAGLRGRLGAGPNRMNRAVVIRAAAGLARYLSDSLGAGGFEGPARVAIGYDARHGSHAFALDTAAVMTAAGHHAMVLPSALPTPVLAYATRALEADAGVMVTASHNPPQDNGYKVYLGGRVVTDEGQGAQIVPPHDAGIAQRIAEVANVASVPRADDGWEDLDMTVLAQYVSQVAGLVGMPPADGSRGDVRIVLTPLHGVGGSTVEATLATAGFTDTHTVAQQAAPDPEFPTVDFPNPEEPGAIDLSLALAEEVGADVVIANDPDADRCAVATVIDGRWQMLHGDVVGALLGERVASRGGHPEGAVLANSIVSSQMLGRIAEAHGLTHAYTLTGFKWIGREPGLVFGYEEALGYCVAPDLVRDKDGVSAAVLVAEYVSELKAAGRTLADAIDDLARAYGIHLTRQVSARFTDIAEIPALMERLLASPPDALAGSTVASTDDMNAGFRGLPPTNGLHLATESGARVIIRPSGTEPKIKAYLEVVEPASASVQDSRERAEDAMDALEADVRSLLGV